MSRPLAPGVCGVLPPEGDPDGSPDGVPDGESEGDPDGESEGEPEAVADWLADSLADGLADGLGLVDGALEDAGSVGEAVLVAAAPVAPEGVWSAEAVARGASDAAPETSPTVTSRRIRARKVQPPRSGRPDAAVQPSVIEND